MCWQACGVDGSSFAGDAGYRHVLTHIIAEALWCVQMEKRQCHHDSMSSYDTSAEQPSEQLPHHSLQPFPAAVIVAAASANCFAASACLPELQHSIYTDTLDKSPEQLTLQLPEQPYVAPSAVKTAIP